MLKINTAKCLLLIGLIASNSSFSQPGEAAKPIISPEVFENGDVTFRLNAPSAKRVQLSSSGDIPVVSFGGGLDMTKNSDGIWEITLESLDSGGYRYNYSVDGLAVFEPSNRSVSESNGKAWSVFYVPGSKFMDTQNVEHGAVAKVKYFSEVQNRHREMHVYTPPGYQLGMNAYPVLYLLHGAGDSNDSWSSVGRASDILDNLIAEGKAEPMIVVMPDGHPTSPGLEGDGMQIEAFAKEFKIDVKPYIESHYRVLTERVNTAIAGLSMGGAHTLEIALADLSEYGYFGVFSSGVFSINQDTSFQDKYLTNLNDSTLKDGLELVWFAIGTDDFLFDTSQATIEMFEDYNFDVTYRESTGGHTWINWREYLNEFVPMLFQ